MSTIKSSAENLTLNADGSGNDIILQSNGSNVATLDQAGLLTATTFAGSGASLTALPAAQLTGSLPAISGASLTGLPGIDADADGWQLMGDVTDQDSAAVVDFPTTVLLGSNLSESGGRITIGTAGWYLICFHMSNQSAYSDTMNVWLRKNTQREAGAIYWAGNTEINYLGMEATVLMACAAGVVIDVYGSGYWTGNTNDEGHTWFTGIRLGA